MQHTLVFYHFILLIQFLSLRCELRGFCLLINLLITQISYHSANWPRPTRRRWCPISFGKIYQNWNLFELSRPGPARTGWGKGLMNAREERWRETEGSRNSNRIKCLAQNKGYSINSNISLLQSRAQRWRPRHWCHKQKRERERVRVQGMKSNTSQPNKSLHLSSSPSMNI